MIQFEHIRHLSLDLWLTLIRSNPRFKPARARLAIEQFGIAATEEETLATFQHFDRLFNVINETTGRNLSVCEMLYIILDRLGVNANRLSMADLEAFYDRSEALFFDHPPQLLDAAIPDTLHRLREQGCTISLLSNTAFVLGRTLRKLMPHLGLRNCFDFQLYSDETGHSKPSPEAYELLYHRAQEVRPLQKCEILHAGDNRIADYDGARNAGLQALLVDPGKQTLTDILRPLSCTRALQSTT